MPVYYKQYLTTNEPAAQCEEVLASVLGLAFHFLKTLRFNGKDPQQLYSVCLYARLLELAVASKALLEKNALVGIPILLRSMFEADLDLTNLMKYPEYFKRMNASFLKEKIRLTKNAESSEPNPFLAAVRVKPNLTDDLRKAQDEMDILVTEKKGPVEIRERAELAGRLDEYKSIYKDLCLDTHNNVRSLEDWHIERTTSDEYHVVLFKKTSADLVHHLSAIPAILLHQTKALADFLKTQEIVFEKYFQELKDLQEVVKKLAVDE